LFGKAIAFDLDQLCYKELAMSGSNATIPSAWPKALQLLESGAVNTEALISNIYSVTDWQEAFDFFEAKTGIKLLLTPA
jgi:L-iditol 2-dehydrogenase